VPCSWRSPPWRALRSFVTQADAQKVAPGAKLVAKAKAKAPVMNPLAREVLPPDIRVHCFLLWGSDGRRLLRLWICPAVAVRGVHLQRVASAVRQRRQLRRLLSHVVPGRRALHPRDDPRADAEQHVQARGQREPVTGMKKSYSLAPTTWNTIAVNPNLGVSPRLSLASASARSPFLAEHPSAHRLFRAPIRAGPGASSTGTRRTGGGDAKGQAKWRHRHSAWRERPGSQGCRVTGDAPHTGVGRRDPENGAWLTAVACMVAPAVSPRCGIACGQSDLLQGVPVSLL